MKRSLPTAGGQARGYTAPPLRERKPLQRPVIAVAQATVGNVATVFAADLARSLVRDGISIDALVTAEEASADTQAALTQLLAAGAQHVSVARVARDAPTSAIDDALSHFPEERPLLVVGNALPNAYVPMFCVIVSAARTTHLPEARQLRILADLELNAPTAATAAELARLIGHRLRA